MLPKHSVLPRIDVLPVHYADRNLKSGQCVRSSDLGAASSVSGGTKVKTNWKDNLEVIARGD